MRARARRAELEVAALERSLLPFDEVVQAWQQLVAAFRAKCLALPSKMAPRLAMSETREIQAVLTAAVREALEELSRFDLPRDRPARPGVASPPPAVTVSSDRGEPGRYQSIRFLHHAIGGLFAPGGFAIGRQSRWKPQPA